MLFVFVSDATTEECSGTDKADVATVFPCTGPRGSVRTGLCVDATLGILVLLFGHVEHSPKSAASRNI
jgi:hypothetical protein